LKERDGDKFKNDPTKVSDYTHCQSHPFRSQYTPQQQHRNQSDTVNCVTVSSSCYSHVPQVNYQGFFGEAEEHQIGPDPEHKIFATVSNGRKFNYVQLKIRQENGKNGLVTFVVDTGCNVDAVMSADFVEALGLKEKVNNTEEFSVIQVANGSKVKCPKIRIQVLYGTDPIELETLVLSNCPAGNLLGISGLRKFPLKDGVTADSIISGICSEIEQQSLSKN